MNTSLHLSIYTLCYCLVLLCGGCGQQSKEKEASTTATSSQKSTAIHINDGEGKEIAAIDLYPVRIRFDGYTLKAKKGSSGKLKYIDQNGTVIAKIKRDGDEKIKLKTNDGELLWKVKINEEAIKIANNEEMNAAYKVKFKSKGRCKLYQSNEEIGKSLSDNGTFLVESQNRSFRVSGNQERIPGIISFKDIPLSLRLVIMAELSR